MQETVKVVCDNLIKHLLNCCSSNNVSVHVWLHGKQQAWVYSDLNYCRPQIPLLPSLPPTLDSLFSPHKVKHFCLQVRQRHETNPPLIKIVTWQFVITHKNCTLDLGKGGQIWHFSLGTGKLTNLLSNVSLKYSHDKLLFIFSLEMICPVICGIKK